MLHGYQQLSLKNSEARPTKAVYDAAILRRMEIASLIFLQYVEDAIVLTCEVVVI